MKFTLPRTMKAVRQLEAGGELTVVELPLPNPGKGEVLVRMAASPFNPSDLSLLKGVNLEKPVYPLTPGLEGSGTVVASGGGVLADLRMGKRVTCSSTEGYGGTWAEYMLTSAMRVIPIKKTIGMEQGAMLIVNPMTALAFMNIAKEGRHKAIVNNAAASVLGKMLIKLCAGSQLPLINIVRRNEHVEMLKKQGAEYVLNSEDEDFEIRLKELTHQLHATLLFDAVGGNQTAKLVDAAPYGSTIVVYSNMSDEPFSIEPRTLIQADKSIKSFFLGGWASKRSILQTLKAARQVQALAGDELSSKVQKRYPIEQADEALNYYLNHMTGGKVLLVMDDTMK